MPPVQKLSADEEKKLRILNFLLKSNAVFSSSTLEQVAKATKVSNMLIKGLIQQLADENLINEDKIGAGTFYWKFESEQSEQLVSKLEEQKQLEAEIRKDIADLDESIEEFTLKFADEADTSALQKELNGLEAELRERELKEGLLQRNSPERLDYLRETAKEAKESANTETDNVFAIVHYLKKSLMVEADEIAEIVNGWTSEFDYLA